MMERYHMKNSNTCNCIKGCPCYPRCDEMMEQWETKPVQKEPRMGSVELSSQDGDKVEFRKLAEENERDFNRFKEMASDDVKMIMTEVEKACDALEYKGSMMFDESLDKRNIQEIADGIRDRIMADWEPEMQGEQERPDMRRPEPNHGPHRRPDSGRLLEDLIKSLLHQEMFHRRCRNRNCRRW